MSNPEMSVSVGRSRLSNPEFALSVARGAVFIFMLIALWSLTHRYLGFDGDAKLYAIQALAKIHPALNHDVYLQNESQDRYTVFSPLYAWCIELFGLQSAELALTIVFKAWFLAAAWSLIRALSTSTVAFLTVASFIILPAGYGALHLFQYSEDWLTARSMAEAMVVTSIAMYVRGFKTIGFVVAIAAMAVHPLMALPGLLLLMCLWLPSRIASIGAAAGVVAVAGVACAAPLLAANVPMFTLLDRDWLEVVRERSQFLFVSLWPVDDWKLNARPLMTLVLTLLVMDDVRVRKLSMAALLVALAGLAVAAIADFIGPVALLIQGQAWRWIWVAGFTAVLLLAPTAIKVWRDDRCGPLCAILLICGWTFSAIDGVYCIGAALAIWIYRNRLTHRSSGYLRSAAAALGVILVGWAIFNVWNIAFSGHVVLGREPVVLAITKNVLALDVIPVLLMGAFAYLIAKSRSIVLLTGTSIALLLISCLVLPGAYKEAGRLSPAIGTDEFADWQRAIPESANVFIAPSPISAAFAWFILGRPSYLSLDQSSGVIFSRKTEVEIRRRAEVALPLWDTNWNVRLVLTPKNGTNKLAPSVRPLTKQTLLRLCHDPQLNFVVAKENVGFNPVAHTHPGTWKDWYLYDCRQVDSPDPTV